MAEVTSVNSQITDSISQIGVNVIGDAPAVALAQLYQLTAQALAQAALASAHAQQQHFILAQAATATGVAALYAAATGSETVLVTPPLAA